MGGGGWWREVSGLGRGGARVSEFFLLMDPNCFFFVLFFFFLDGGGGWGLMGVCVGGGGGRAGVSDFFTMNPNLK